MRNIVKMIFGAHLYGTETKASDKDYKGVFMPSCEQIFLGTIPKSLNYSTGNNNSKNSANDVDTEFYSLHYFIKLALEGQIVAFDMLHAPDEFILENSEIWTKILKNRKKFYTKNLKAFISYVRKQAAKYGIKGSRLDAAKSVFDLLNRCDPNQKVKTIWHKLPKNKHCKFLDKNKNGLEEYQVCGKAIQESAKIGYCANMVKLFYDTYGDRAKQAAENKNIDWKAISHAVRVAMQMKMILVDENIIFPLPQANIILEIKQGKLDYLTEAAPFLENIISEVEELAKNSCLPIKPNFTFWERFLLENVKKSVL